MLELEFNNWFDGFYFYHPKAKALAPKIKGKAIVPYRFSQRLNLFLDASRLCFTDCQSLVKKLELIASQLNTLHDFRDLAAHSQWFDGAANKSSFQSYLWIGDRPKITPRVHLSRLERNTRRMNELQCKLIDFRNAGGIFPGWTDLTPREQSALQDFRTNNLPTPPTPMWLRRRAGSPPA
jgi:hypothetical protein